MASDDPGGWVWGCDPNVDSACGQPCTAYQRECPGTAWACYPYRNANGTTLDDSYGCDCNRYYGCTGGGCTDPSPGVWCYYLITGLTISAISLPTIFQSAKSLIKMKRSGKLEWGAPTMCMLFTGLSAFFGYFVHFEDFLVGPFECQQEYHPDLFHTTLSMCQSLFGMFIVLSVITILLMWIDVHIKSKSMQKMSQDNSLVKKCQKALWIGAIVFAFVFFCLYVIDQDFGVMWTFLYVLGLLAIIPFGAVNLVQILTGVPSTNCCTALLNFSKSAFPAALCCRRSSERVAIFEKSDPTSSAGKFTLTRLKMAEVVEVTAVRVWVCLIMYFAAAIVYLLFGSGTSHLVEPGSMSVTNYCAIFIFTPLHVAVRQMFAYCKYTLRDLLDDTRGNSNRKVSAGMSVNSSTATDDTATTIQVGGGSSSEDKYAVEPPVEGAERRLSNAM